MSCRNILETISSRSTSSLALAPRDPVQVYKSLVALGNLRHDPNQLQVLVQLRNIWRKLDDYDPTIRLRRDKKLSQLIQNLKSLPNSSQSDQVFQQNGRSLFSRLFSSPTGAIGTRDLVRTFKDDDLKNLDTPRGAMLIGPPGSGKTMLMELFFNAVGTQHKIRRHYHQFLLSLYHEIFIETEKQKQILDNSISGPWNRQEENRAIALSQGWKYVFGNGRDPNDPTLQNEFVLAIIAHKFIQNQGWLLAFDEVQLVDIAGANILRRFLEWYWRFGGVVVATSNKMPEDLYRQGVQGALLAPFLDLLANRCPVLQVQGGTDWRRESTRGRSPYRSNSVSQNHNIPQRLRSVWDHWNSTTWFLDEDEFEKTIKIFDNRNSVKDHYIKVYGRRVNIPWSTNEGVAKFDFKQLCEQELGPADYLSLSSNFHTVIIQNIPILYLNAKNEARRFITCIDALYESGVRLICHAQALPDQMFFPDAIQQDGQSLNVDSITQESFGDVIQELENPYRPNIASYDITEQQTVYKDASLSSTNESGTAKRNNDDKLKYASSPVPAFENLAIFTGSDERFSFERAVSRLHEFNSIEYVKYSDWTPFDDSARPWENVQNSFNNNNESTSTLNHSEHVQRQDDNTIKGSEDANLLLSLSPEQIKVKYPQGTDNLAAKELNQQSCKPPKISSNHIWGIQKWGKKAGRWGQGVDAYHKKE